VRVQLREVDGEDAVLIEAPADATAGHPPDAAPDDAVTAAEGSATR